MFTTANLPPGVTDSFTHLCHTCGETCTVTSGIEQPHLCRIVLP